MAFHIRRLRILILLSAAVVISFYYIGIGQSTKSLERVAPPHWSPRKERYPVRSLIPLPTGTLASIPTIQAKPQPEDETAQTERLRRQAAVKASFVHCWEGYKTNAWLSDEVVPIAGGSRTTFGGWAATLVDALDTLWIMDMTDDFEAAVLAVQDIDFTTTETKWINIFETNIRYLGGFLAAYDISDRKYPALLTKAVEVADLMMSAFDTPNRMPNTRWDWQFYVNGNKQKAPSQLLVSELGSLSLEFTHLSQLSGDLKYYDAIQRISDLFEEHQDKTQLPGMWPISVDAAAPGFNSDNRFHLGGMSDSLYEYLPKQYLMLGGALEQPRKLYEKFIDVAKEKLFFRALNPKNEDILFSGEIRVASNKRVDLTTKAQHLGCFIGGMVAIGSRIFDRPDELKIAEKLTNGCVWAYDAQITGIAPEVFSLIGCISDDDDCLWSEEKWLQGIKNTHVVNPGPDQTEEDNIREKIKDLHLVPGFTNLEDTRYILRPEAIESVFIMYRITGDVEWQNKAWQMFERIEQVTKTEIASSAIDNVALETPNQMDSMESFWLAETLKYFYLIFSDVDLVSLDQYVLNTEAHPLKRPWSRAA